MTKKIAGRLRTGEGLGVLEYRAELVAKRRCNPAVDAMCGGVHERWTQGDRTLDQASGLVQDPKKVEVLLLVYTAGSLKGQAQTDHGGVVTTPDKPPP